MIPNKDAFLKKYPMILNYTAGRRDGKYVIKVFLQRKDAITEDFFRENCSNADDFEFNFIYATELLMDAKFLNETPPISTQEIEKLRKIIHKEEDKIVALHSNIIGIDIGRTMLNETEFGDPCIVLKCLDKTIVPFGESEIPKFLQGYMVDIREDFIMFASCVNCHQLANGCTIGRRREQSTGSVGFFVKPRLSKTVGFLTAAHVALGNVSELTESSEPFQGDFHEIVHPSSSDNVIGRVTKAYFGNWESNEYPQGIDAAYVHLDEPNTRG